MRTEDVLCDFVLFFVGVVCRRRSDEHRFYLVVQDGGYPVTGLRVVAIFTADPRIAAARAPIPRYLLMKGKSVWIPQACRKDRFYAIGSGTDWSGSGPDINRA